MESLVKLLFGRDPGPLAGLLTLDARHGIDLAEQHATRENGARPPRGTELFPLPG